MHMFTSVIRRTFVAMGAALVLLFGGTTAMAAPDANFSSPTFPSMGAETAPRVIEGTSVLFGDHMAALSIQANDIAIPLDANAFDVGQPFDAMGQDSTNSPTALMLGTLNLDGSEVFIEPATAGDPDSIHGEESGSMPVKVHLLTAHLDGRFSENASPPMGNSAVPLMQGHPTMPAGDSMRSYMG